MIQFNDKRLIKLRQEAGWDWYGIYLAICELLKEAPDYKLEVTYDNISLILDPKSPMDPDEIKEIIEDFDLFEINDGYFSSPDVDTFMKQEEIIRKLDGYICLFRKIIEWEWFTEGHMFKVFVYCIMRANWKDTKWKGKPIKRIQFITSYDTIARETGITYDQARLCIEKLVDTGEVTYKTTNKYGIVSVLKYDDYQCKVKEGEPSQEHSQSTGRTQSEPIQAPGRTQAGHSQSPTDKTVYKDKTLNNVNNDKNVNKASPPPAHRPGDGDGDDPSKELTLQNNPSDISIIIEYLNNITSKNYKATAVATSTDINKLLQQGYTVADCKTVINNKWQEWKGTERVRFVQPSTLFGNGKFDQYLNQPGNIQSSSKSSNKPVGDFSDGTGGY